MMNNRQISARYVTWLFALTYLVSYVTRVNYGAVISEMVLETGYSRSLLAAALTGSFVTYGLGQIVSGICGDRFSPKNLVLCGLVVTSAMNGLIPLCEDPYSMLAVWSVNGFAQAFLWPPLVRLMTALLTSGEYARAVVRVSWGSSIGTMLVYLISPAMIALAGWKGVFLASSICGALMALAWVRLCPDVTVARRADARHIEARDGSFFSPMLLGIMLAIVLQGMLRDGVTTWMPSYISETYGLSNELGILTGVVLPLFSILCFQAASTLYGRCLKNALLCAGVIFGFGAVSALALSLLSGSAFISVLLAALLTGAMHGVNLILISMVPPFFGRYGTVSTVSGVLNSCTYVGSAVSAYGIAVLSERAGWSATLRLWVVIASVGTAICFLCVKAWSRRFPAESE